RQRLSPYENVDKALLSWIKYARLQNSPLSWNVLKEKSLEFANELDESSFVASNGWLQRFSSRHNLSFKKLCGEAADFDSSSLKEWKDVVLRNILEKYESANVFNVDECGLFYRILPDRTLCFKDNCAAHCTVDGLKSIELVFLPPNSTCVLQPLDQGIIQNFKATYRKLLLQDMISVIDRKEQLQVSVLNAIFYIDQSWNMVSQKT
ncbi:Tigger transposable element-derived protein 6, partial [Araneus ventricosus]